MARARSRTAAVRSASGLVLSQGHGEGAAHGGGVAEVDRQAAVPAAAPRRRRPSAARHTPRPVRRGIDLPVLEGERHALQGLRRARPSRVTSPRKATQAARSSALPVATRRRMRARHDLVGDQRIAGGVFPQPVEAVALSVASLRLVGQPDHQRQTGILRVLLVPHQACKSGKVSCPLSRWAVLASCRRTSGAGLLVCQFGQRRQHASPERVPALAEEAHGPCAHGQGSRGPAVLSASASSKAPTAYQAPQAAQGAGLRSCRRAWSRSSGATEQSRRSPSSRRAVRCHQGLSCFSSCDQFLDSTSWPGRRAGSPFVPVALDLVDAAVRRVPAVGRGLVARVLVVPVDEVDVAVAAPSAG